MFEQKKSIDLIPNLYLFKVADKNLEIASMMRNVSV